MKRDNLRMRQTHRVSSDFRRGFNQKISRMDEALMQFTDTQVNHTTLHYQMYLQFKKYPNVTHSYVFFLNNSIKCSNLMLP